MKINTDNLVCYYYFNNEEEKNSFINNYSFGDTIKINGKLTIPSNNTIPNTFNYKKYLYYKNIEYILNIKSFKKIKDNKNIFYTVKNRIYKRIDSIPNNEYIYAFILGDSSYMGSEIYDNYRLNGVTHLFAVSALHISLFSSFLFNVLRKIKIKYNYSFFIVFIFLLFYSYIIGFTPSVLRALIFFTFNKLFKIINIKTNKINILYLTVVIILLINPNYIYNNGFLLSIVISYFLLSCKGKMNLLKINFLAFISSLPIIINMYYEVNLLSIIVNLLFIPIVTRIIFPLSIMCLLFSRLSNILKLLTNTLELLSVVCNKIFSLNIIISKLNILEIIIYYLLLIIVIKKNKKFKYILLMFIFFLYFKPIFNNSKNIYFLDVKQGDSTLITSNTKSILIDTGGLDDNYNIMSSSLIVFFKSIGIKKINYLIITHGDFDHMGYSIDLINNFKVNKVIFNCGSYNDLESELIKVLDKKKVKYYSCIKELIINDNKLYFLQTNEYDNENDNSNVVYTEFNGYKFMFMGDASTTTEKEIIDKYNLPDIDILKVGHHGSRTSSSKNFINEINPRYSVISVGKYNRYGHPNKEVLDNLKDTKIYRTDEDGSIMFKIKNNKLKIETCTP